MARKAKKTEREILSEQCNLVTKLLLWEMSGGIIPLPAGVENYTPPNTPFNDRSKFLADVKKGLLVDMKINPDSEESGFELLKGELDERTRKRGGNAVRDRGVSPSLNGENDPDESDDADDTFAGGSNQKA